MLPLPWGPPASELPAPLAAEPDIAAHHAAALTLFRLAANPHILVLDFPDLAAQGRMLNRVAAFIEKASTSHVHVLDDAALAAAIRADGATPETYYYGHDYRVADLLRFLATADREGIRLNPDEQYLRGLLRAAGPDAIGALISVPRAGTDPTLDEAARASILQHELSHGQYFTDPAYAARIRAAWRTRLTEAERALVRGFLARGGYDATDEDLMINEAQAYLLHTPDPRQFSAAILGTSTDELARLRAGLSQ
jgi:hypothetical protein